MPTIEVKSEITGTVWKIEAGVGDELQADDVIAILESMKMEIPVTAPAGGRLLAIHVSENAPVTDGQVIALMETP